MSAKPKAKAKAPRPSRKHRHFATATPTPLAELNSDQARAVAELAAAINRGDPACCLQGLGFA